MLTRDSAISYLSTVTVAPITSTILGVPSEVLLRKTIGTKQPRAVNLHNAITVSQDRLGKRVGRLNSVRMAEICAALRFSLGCDLTQPSKLERTGAGIGDSIRPEKMRDKRQASTVFGVRREGK